MLPGAAFRVTLVASALAAFGFGAASALGVGPEVVSNGSFEVPISNNDWEGADRYAAPSTFGGWTVISGDIDLVRAGVPGPGPVPGWNAADGQQSVDLDGGTAGAISQTLATIAGATYTLSFSMGGNCGFASPIKTMEVEFGSTVLGPYAYDCGSSYGAGYTSIVWEPHTELVVATSSSTTLVFRSLAGGGATGHGPAVDAVSVTANLPTTKEECRNGGWESFGVFKNQGDCVSFVASGGKSGP